MSEHFIGRAVDSAEAAERADVLVVAELLDPGTADPGPPGQAYHYGAKIRIVGDLIDDLSGGDRSISFSVQRTPPDIAESVPSKNDRFIFFLHREPDGNLNAEKVIPATPQAIRALARRSMGNAEIERLAMPPSGGPPS